MCKKLIKNDFSSRSISLEQETILSHPRYSRIRFSFYRSELFLEYYVCFNPTHTRMWYIKAFYLSQLSNHITCTTTEPRMTMFRQENTENQHKLIKLARLNTKVRRDKKRWRRRTRHSLIIIPTIKHDIQLYNLYISSIPKNFTS